MSESQKPLQILDIFNTENFITNKDYVTYKAQGLLTVPNGLKFGDGSYLNGDFYSVNGTLVLDVGTDGTDATFNGDVNGDLYGDIYNADSTKIFDSGNDSTTPSFTQSLKVTGATTLASTLNVTGATTLSGQLNANTVVLNNPFFDTEISNDLNFPSANPFQNFYTHILLKASDNFYREYFIGLLGDSNLNSSSSKTNVLAFAYVGGSGEQPKVMTVIEPNGDITTTGKFIGTGAELTGTLDVTGATTLASLDVTGATTLASLNVTGTLECTDITGGYIDIDMPTGALSVYGNSTLRGAVRLHSSQKSVSSSHYVQLRSPVITSSHDFIFPVDVGSNGYVLSTDGNTGQTSWVAQPSTPDLDEVLTSGASSSISSTVSLNNATMQIDILKANEMRPLVTSLVFKDSNANNITAIEDNTNIYFGRNALSAVANANTNNTAYGYSALRYAYNGTDNVAVGYESLLDVADTDYNTAIGTSAGKSHNGSNNTFVGYNAGNSGGGTIYTFSNSTAIGSGSVITKSNEVVLGTSSEEVSVPGSLVVTNNVSADTIQLDNSATKNSGVIAATITAYKITFNAENLTYNTFSCTNTAPFIIVNEYVINNSRENGIYILRVKNNSSTDMTFRLPSSGFKWNHTSIDFNVAASRHGILTFYVFDSTTYLSIDEFR